MFHFLPVAIRYDGSARPPRATATRCTSGPMYADTRGWIRIASTDPTAAPEDAVQLPVHGHRPQGVGRGDPGRARHPQPAGVRARSTTVSCRLGPSVETDEEILDWVRADAETALHPSCTAKMGTGEDSVTDPTLDEGARPRGRARRRRQRLPLRHQRQHLRPGDDGRREGRRPDPGQHAPYPRRQVPYYRHGTDSRCTHPGTAGTITARPSGRPPTQGRCGHDRDSDHHRNSNRRGPGLAP